VYTFFRKAFGPQTLSVLAGRNSLNCDLVIERDSKVFYTSSGHLAVVDGFWNGLKLKLRIVNLDLFVEVYDA
jgi:hypothetical protein